MSFRFWRTWMMELSFVIFCVCWLIPPLCKHQRCCWRLQIVISLLRCSRTLHLCQTWDLVPPWENALGRVVIENKIFGGSVKSLCTPLECESLQRSNRQRQTRVIAVDAGVGEIVENLILGRNSWQIGASPLSLPRRQPRTQMVIMFHCLVHELSGFVVTLWINPETFSFWTSSTLGHPASETLPEWISQGGKRTIARKIDIYRAVVSHN